MSRTTQITGKAFTKTACEVPAVGFSIIDADKSVTKTPSILEIMNVPGDRRLYFLDEGSYGVPVNSLAKHWDALK